MNENNKNSDNLKSGLEQALMFLKQADDLIAIAPKNEFSHFLKSYALLFVFLAESQTIGSEQSYKRIDESLKEIDIAIALNPNNKMFHYYKGHMLFILKKYEEALKE